VGVLITCVSARGDAYAVAPKRVRTAVTIARPTLAVVYYTIAFYSAQLETILYPSESLNREMLFRCPRQYTEPTVVFVYSGRYYVLSNRNTATDFNVRIRLPQKPCNTPPSERIHHTVSRVRLAVALDLLYGSFSV